MLVFDVIGYMYGRILQVEANGNVWFPRYVWPLIEWLKAEALKMPKGLSTEGRCSTLAGQQWPRGNMIDYVEPSDLPPK